ncbi:MAG: hypothetical protein LH632_21245, partial [Rhodoferax sp.]|nr:hypothetical protein [Rhodoferax sp.]
MAGVEQAVVHPRRQAMRPSSRYSISAFCACILFCLRPLRLTSLHEVSLRRNRMRLFQLPKQEIFHQ